MHHLSIDLETYSSIPIANGAQRYIASDDFEILLWAYSLDGAPVEIVDLAQGERVPGWLEKALLSPDYIKHAFNAHFEMGCLSKHFGFTMDPSQWRCTMFHGLYCGYPGSLDSVGKAIGLADDKKKSAIGKNLIRYFCVPCKPSKVNGGRTRNYPHHAPDKWNDFKGYCKQDVVTEMAVESWLSAFPVPGWLQAQWETDWRINMRGVYVDMNLVHGALNIGAVTTADLMAEAMQLTGLENPNSIPQLFDWVKRQGVDIPDLTKETVADTLAKGGLSPKVARVLAIRQELGKTSTKKYDAIEACVCPDGRVRGLLQFYGANRTGRWAGRLVQVQNLPRTYTQAIDLARRLVRMEKKDLLRLTYGSVPDTLSQLIRTAFIATPGNVLIDADFSAIEARVISWLAGENWRLDVFRTHGKIYEASASQMFGVPIERIKKGNPEYALRARGKVAELALGYQGGVSAMRRMDTGHDLDSLSDDEMQEIVNQWRETNSKIRDLWWTMQDAAIKTIKNGVPVPVKNIIISKEYDPLHKTSVMSIYLPSGRKLYYLNPRLGENRWGGDSILYDGVDQTSRQWKTLETYGGKLTENVVQAIARDCLAVAIERLEKAGFPIVFHVHDEVVIDRPRYADDKTMLQDVERLMTAPVPWALGLPLGADGWVGDFFTKD